MTGPPPQYLERIRTALESAVLTADQSLLLLPDSVPDDDALSVTHWMYRILDESTSGRLPDLSAFPHLGISADTPGDDFRWKVYQHACNDLRELGQAGFLILPGPGDHFVSALQVIVNERIAKVRINQAVRGVFWGYLRPDWLQIGWELPADERDNTTHLTVLHGKVADATVALVFWNATPSVIRAASHQKLLKMTGNSIGISAVRTRWQAVREQWMRDSVGIGPDEIRSALYLADKRGIRLDARGSFVVDYLVGSRREKTVPECDLEDSEGAALVLDEFATSPLGGPEAPAPDEEYLSGERAAFAKEELRRIFNLADADEKLLLNAWLREFLSRGEAKLRQVARQQGWPTETVEAVKKRLLRKLQKYS